MGFRRSATLLPWSRRAMSVTALAVFALWLVVPGVASAGEARNIGILDRCDPASFNAVLGDGACLMRNGGVPFDTFLERVNPKDGGHNAWRFTPEQVSLSGGQFLRLDNRGGETHTFTEVVDFGGGFVDELNAALPPGTPLAEPIGPLRFIDAGQRIDLPVQDAGTHLFECLIHPWMRTTVAQTSG
jgi:plastocyanin